MMRKSAFMVRGSHDRGEKLYCKNPNSNPFPPKCRPGLRKYTCTLIYLFHLLNHKLYFFLCISLSHSVPAMSSFSYIFLCLSLFYLLYAFSSVLSSLSYLCAPLSSLFLSTFLLSFLHPSSLLSFLIYYISPHYLLSH